MVSGLTGTFSPLAICSRRLEVDEMSRGLKRNLEQRDARGSIILYIRREASGKGKVKLSGRGTGRMTYTLSHSCTQDRIGLYVRTAP